MAKAACQELFPDDVFEDPELGVCWDGVKKRGSHQAPYDWLQNGRRVECKSAQLIWDCSQCRWYVQFQNVVLPACNGKACQRLEDLLLIMYTPRGLFLFQHNLLAGISKAGVATNVSGSRVTFCGARKCKDWQLALNSIQDKMLAAGCRLLVEIPWNSPLVGSLPALKSQDAASPLVASSQKQRGQRLEEIAIAVDQLYLHTFSKTCKTKHRADYDWTRDGAKIECKSAYFRPGADRVLQFRNVKFAADDKLGAFDELWLVMRSEFGLHIFEHDLESGRSSHGKATATSGFSIKFFNSRAVLSSPWHVQLRWLMDKLAVKSSCKLLAVVPWSDASQD